MTITMFNGNAYNNGEGNANVNGDVNFNVHSEMTTPMSILEETKSHLLTG